MNYFVIYCIKNNSKWKNLTTYNDELDSKIVQWYWSNRPKCQTGLNA